MEKSYQQGLNPKGLSDLGIDNFWRLNREFLKDELNNANRVFFYFCRTPYRKD